MPLPEHVRARIIALVQAYPNISRRNLVRMFGPSYRDQAKHQVSLMLGEQLLQEYGIGKKGSRKVIGIGAAYGKRVCPACGQQIVEVPK